MYFIIVFLFFLGFGVYVVVDGSLSLAGANGMEVWRAIPTILIGLTLIVFPVWLIIQTIKDECERPKK